MPQGSGDWRCFRQRDVMKSRGVVSTFVKSRRIEGFPCWLSGKRTCLPSRRTLGQEDPWRRKWQHIAVFFPWDVEVEKSLEHVALITGTVSLRQLKWFLGSGVNYLTILSFLVF